MEQAGYENKKIVGVDPLQPITYPSTCDRGLSRIMKISWG